MNTVLFKVQKKKPGFYVKISFHYELCKKAQYLSENISRFCWTKLHFATIKLHGSGKNINLAAF